MAYTSPSARPSLKPMAALAALALTPMLASCGVVESRAEAMNLGGDTVVQAAPSEQAAGEPPAGQNSGRQCFFARNVTGFRNIEGEDGRRVEDRVLIDVGAADTYEFGLQRRCPGLRFSRSIALDQTGVGRICDGLDVDLIVSEGGISQRCPVTMVRKLSAGELNARAGAKE